jgi:DNA-binding GntR family transcriptional regulator
MDAVSDAAAPVRQPLPAVVAERLRELIVEGELPPGSRLSERQLCERLGVSRTPLRGGGGVPRPRGRGAPPPPPHDGLVALEPHRGARVPAMSRDAVRQSFELMGALEALAAELACERITDAEIDEIEALTFEMRACHARRDLHEYYRRNRAVHGRIGAAARNPLLDETSQRLDARIQNLRYRSNLDAHKWAAALDEHEKMVALLRRRDGAALARLMREHLRRKAEAVLAMVPDAAAAPA